MMAQPLPPPLPETPPANPAPLGGGRPRGAFPKGTRGIRRDAHAHELSAYEYELPVEQIAQEPMRPRDAAKLLVLARNGDVVAHARLRDLPDFLPERSLLVVNDTKVVPARFFGRRATGGRVEFLLVRRHTASEAEALVKASGALAEGEEIAVTLPTGAALTPPPDAAPGYGTVQLGAPRAHGTRAITIPSGWLDDATLDAIGVTPLPPYIERKPDDARIAPGGADRTDYQTVFAKRGQAVAAPTAGLHFTEEMLERLAAAGHEWAAVTLDVGPGTFAPVRVANIREHELAPERYWVTAEVLDRLRAARALERPLVAIGTTSVRVLETLADSGWLAGTAATHDVTGEFLQTDSDSRPALPTMPMAGVTAYTDLFCYPPYRFRTVDGLLTNFHLPRSTLLMLVAAFVDRRVVLERYREAIALGYRFYSYGDAMLVLPQEPHLS